MHKSNELYEVKCTINDLEYQSVFEGYMMKKHIPDILKTNCFTNIYFVREEEGEATYRISYFSENKDNIAKYLKEFAPTLRDDFLKNIDTKLVNVSRRFASCTSFSYNTV